MEIITGLLAFVGLIVVVSLILPYAMALLVLMLKHWIISAITMIIIGYLMHKAGSGSSNPCPGCWECDPQAFTGEDGEIHTGL